MLSAYHGAYESMSHFRILTFCLVLWVDTAAFTLETHMTGANETSVLAQNPQRRHNQNTLQTHVRKMCLGSGI